MRDKPAQKHDGESLSSIWEANGSVALDGAMCRSKKGTQPQEQARLPIPTNASSL
jgi:hypothetical protein